MASNTEYPGWLRMLKRRVPPGIKRAVREAWRQHTLSRTLQQLARLPARGMPSRRMLTSLRVSWGNEGWSGSLEYLEEVAGRAITATGPILECGSGLTTILLGLLAGKRGIEVWSLENMEEWHAYVSAMLRQHSISGVRLCFSPFREYGNFAWYAPPSEMPKNFALVICDGPGDSYAGRYGLLPVLGQWLSVGALILVDDSSEMADIIDQWLTTMPVELVTRGPQFSVLRVARKDANTNGKFVSPTFASDESAGNTAAHIERVAT